MDGQAHRRLNLLWAVLALLATARVVHLAAFLVDVSATDNAVAPRLRELDAKGVQKPFFPQHNCFTCYAIAVDLAEQGAANLYDPAHYRDAAEPTATHAEIGDHLNVDRYQYPPPFLLLPAVLTTIGGGFYGARALFFFLELLVLAGTLALLARWLARGAPPEARWRTWLAWPLLVGATTTLLTLQIGNVHLFVIALSVLALLAFEHGRPVTGGALLGFAVASKLFPGLLLVWLLARRRYRDVAWTAGFVVAFAAATALVFGPLPFTAFVSDHLGRLASGEAFGFAFHSTRAMLVNSSVEGIAHRLGKLGWFDDPARLGKVIAWGYGFAVLVATWIVARRSAREPGDATERRATLAAWLGLLVLAQLRSPFLPWGYGAFTVLWLIAVLAGGARTARGWIALLFAYAVFATPLPLPFGPRGLALDHAFGLLGTLLAIGLSVGALRTSRSPRS